MTVTTLSPAPHAQVPSFLRLLAHDLRWRLMLSLARSDHRVQELVAMLNQPANLVSYHLKKLREGQVVRERRSSADGRDIYYSIDLRKLRDLYFEAGDALHPAMNHSTNGAGGHSGQPIEQSPERGSARTAKKERVLFLCTHNSARSQMAEAILRHIGGDIVEVYSAGTEPSRVHPDAIRVMASMGIDISSHYSKHLNEFRDQKFDYIVTVCDKAREACPYFPGDPQQIHWSFPDPSGVEDEEERLMVFKTIAFNLLDRNRFLLSLIQGDLRRNR
jgi:protein-tyrosine-phosphatase